MRHNRELSNKTIRLAESDFIIRMIYKYVYKFVLFIFLSLCYSAFWRSLVNEYDDDGDDDLVVCFFFNVHRHLFGFSEHLLSLLILGPTCIQCCCALGFLLFLLFCNFCDSETDWCNTQVLASYKSQKDDSWCFTWSASNISKVKIPSGSTRTTATRTTRCEAYAI